MSNHFEMIGNSRLTSVFNIHFLWIKMAEQIIAVPVNLVRKQRSDRLLIYQEMI